jgi:hypothetical protein
VSRATPAAQLARLKVTYQGWRISRYLGHHSAAFTLATYTHLMPAADDRMRQAVDAAWAGAADGPATAQGGAVRSD